LLGLVIAIGGPAGVLTLFGIIMIVLIRCNKKWVQNYVENNQLVIAIHRLSV